MIDGHTYILLYEYPRENSPPVWVSMSYWPVPLGYMRRSDSFPPINSQAFCLTMTDFETAKDELAGLLKPYEPSL